MRSEIQMLISEVGGTIDRATPRSIEREPANGMAFADQLGKAVAEVDKLQMDADHQAKLVADGAGNLHEVALALEKADVAMRLAVKVRNKIVETYNDIMRMSV